MIRQLGCLLSGGLGRLGKKQQPSHHEVLQRKNTDDKNSNQGNKLSDPVHCINLSWDSPGQAGAGWGTSINQRILYVLVIDELAATERAFREVAYSPM